jgi:hypothetical protein
MSVIHFIALEVTSRQSPVQSISAEGTYQLISTSLSTAGTNMTNRISKCSFGTFFVPNSSSRGSRVTLLNIGPGGSVASLAKRQRRPQPRWAEVGCSRVGGGGTAFRRLGPDVADVLQVEVDLKNLCNVRSESLHRQLHLTTDSMDASLSTASGRCLFPTSLMRPMSIMS